MPKKLTDYYYSFTSPPPPGSPSSETPSAPLLVEESHNTNSLPPPPNYEDAIRKIDLSIPFISRQPPAKKLELAGYVRDQSISPFNPSSSSSSTSPSAAIGLDDQRRSLPSTAKHHNAEYTAGDYDNDDQEPLLNSYDDDQRSEHQLTQLPPAPPPQPQQQENHFPPPNYSQYRPQYQSNKTGILSRDRHLNRDGEALTQFLQQHNIPPRMKIRFHGYHDETYYKTKSVRDKHGNWMELRKPVTKRVDDFQFDLDCSDMVSGQCHGVYVLPDPKTAQIKTVRQLCDDYVHEPNHFKELHLTKVINWDYAQLTQAFTTAIRAQGYYHSIAISYELANHVITIKADSKLSKMADHWAVRWFSYVTCLCVFTWPYLWFSRKKFGYSTLKSEWKMKISEREWYEQHIQLVLCQIPPTPRYTNATPLV